MNPGPPTHSQIKADLQRFYDWVANNNAQTFVSDQFTQDAIKGIFGNTMTTPNKTMPELTMTTPFTEAFTEEEATNIRSLKAIVADKWKDLVMFLPVDFDMSRIVIAGGCFTSWFYGEEPKDIDVFSYGITHPIHEKYDLSYALQRYKHIHTVTRSKYNVNNDMITDVFNEKSGFQFITTKYNTRKELINHFDYSHCMISYDGDKLYISRETYDAMKNKHLIVNNKDRIAEWRTAKFLSRGFTDPDAKSVLSVPLSGMRINPLRTPIQPLNDPWISA